MADTPKTYLDKDGVIYLWDKIKGTFVSKDGTKVLSTNDYTTDEKNKLAGINAGAEVNKIAAIKVNGTAVTIDEKTVNINVPTNNNELTNGAGYQTSSEVQQAINNAIGKMTGISFEVVTTLPETGEAGKIYLISHSHTDTGDNYDEYVYITDSEGNAKFEKIGNTDVDLSSYVKSEDLKRIENTEIDTITK